MSEATDGGGVEGVAAAVAAATAAAAAAMAAAEVAMVRKKPAASCFDAVV